MRDGWYALIVAILCGKSVEDAFKVIEGKGTTKRHNWTKEAVEDVLALRGQGKTWGEIGDLFGLSAHATYRAVTYARKRYGL